LWLGGCVFRIRFRLRVGKDFSIHPPEERERRESLIVTDTYRLVSSLPTRRVTQLISHRDYTYYARVAMKKRLPDSLVKVTISLLSAACVSAGCASNSELTKVQNEARNAQRTADMALSTAQNALSTAQHAQSISDQANDRALRSEEALNRGFRYSMRK